jgi:hypothetical protein
MQGLLMAAFAFVVFTASPAWAIGLAGFEYSGIHDLRSTDAQITGTDTTIASVCRSMTYIDGQPQRDYLINIDHDCFSVGDIKLADGMEFAKGISEHATAIGGILAGSDPNAYYDQIGEFYYEGVAPDARIDIYEFWRFVSNYVYGGREFQADVLTMSVGTVFQEWWTRGIERLIERDGLIVTAGIGNGKDVYDPVLYPGASANVIGVGVIDSLRIDGTERFSLPSMEHSSTGPTVDGRCGPDIVAPGSFIVPDANSANGYYITDDWSSFATPVVSGTIALLMQKAKSDESLQDAAAKDGGNCVMRAILLNSARKLPYWHKGDITGEDDHQYPLDFIQGAGALDAAKAFEHLTAGRGGEKGDGTIGWDNNAIERIKDSENVYQIDVAESAGKYITATLVWNRHYQDKYPFSAKPQADTDLRVELWAVDSDTQQRRMIDYSDSADDNIEHIYFLADPDYTSYELVVAVSGAGEKGSDFQGYGFVWNVQKPDGREDGWKHDLNSDGRVDDLDLSSILGKIDKPYTGVRGDFNLDGTIDVKDVKSMMDLLDSKE